MKFIACVLAATWSLLLPMGTLAQEPSEELNRRRDEFAKKITERLRTDAKRGEIDNAKVEKIEVLTQQWRANPTEDSWTPMLELIQNICRDDKVTFKVTIIAVNSNGEQVGGLRIRYRPKLRTTDVPSYSQGLTPCKDEPICGGEYYMWAEQGQTKVSDPKFIVHVPGKDEIQIKIDGRTYD